LGNMHYLVKLCLCGWRAFFLPWSSQRM
jgi:hypothetical protein